MARRVPHSRRSGRRTRRGSVYVLVLVTAMILTVIGISGVAVSRVNFRFAQMGREAGEARLLAMAAVEQALAMIDANPTWGATYVGKNLPPATAYAGGTIQWRITDNGDGSFKILGTGVKGGATRLLSATYSSVGSPEVLTKAVYAAGNIVAGGTTTYIGGPIVSGATYTNNSTTNGNVEAVALVNFGTISGTYTSKAPLALPPPSIFDLYKGMATDIPYAATSGVFNIRLFSATSNPYGSPNAGGVYSIDVPAASTLTITKSRLVATLVVTLQAGATFRLQQANLWERPAGNYPILLIKAVGAATIDLNGFAQQLSEPNTLFNFNPAGTPYLGVSDTDILDTYPTELRGLIHIFGAGAVTNAGSNFTVVGGFITAGSFNPGSNTKITLDPALAGSPPVGYSAASGVSSWRWEVIP